jgi:hypothetical protein
MADLGLMRIGTEEQGCCGPENKGKKVFSVFVFLEIIS